MDLAGARPRARVGESTSPDSTQGADASWTTLAAASALALALASELASAPEWATALERVPVSAQEAAPARAVELGLVEVAASRPGLWCRSGRRR